ncbi:unnamed protein product [Clavelina lepadiformis]|uniref:Uncharacterized protein n=1 Tax=Clavelina lepadiformis TaxID=159417 RepID=A0ABP0GNE1_CLALP
MRMSGGRMAPHHRAERDNKLDESPHRSTSVAMQRELHYDATHEKRLHFSHSMTWLRSFVPIDRGRLGLEVRITRMPAFHDLILRRTSFNFKQTSPPQNDYMGTRIVFGSSS